MRPAREPGLREASVAPVQPRDDFEVLGGRDEIDLAVAIEVAGDEAPEVPRRPQPGNRAAGERQANGLSVWAADYRNLIRAAVTVQISEEPIVGGGRAALDGPERGDKRDGLPQAMGGHVHGPHVTDLFWHTIDETESYSREVHMAEAPTVEKHAGLAWIRGSGLCRQWNGIEYKLGMSGKNVGATQLSMNVATIPPGGVAGAHIHVGFEVMLYILEGRVRHDYGEDLVYRVEHQAGDFIFIEPGVPHEVYNLSETDPVVAVVARSSADEWDRIVPYVKKTDRR
jgi:uncharacterized RmlC-like cupin family protein